MILRYLNHPVLRWISTCSQRSDQSSLSATFNLIFPCNNSVKEKAGRILISTMSSAGMTKVFRTIQQRSSIRSGKTGGPARSSSLTSQKHIWVGSGQIPSFSRTTSQAISRSKKRRAFGRVAPACAPRKRADAQVCPHDAAILPLKIEFVSSVRKRIGIRGYPRHDSSSVSFPGPSREIIQKSPFSKGGYRGILDLKEISKAFNDPRGKFVNFLLLRFEHRFDVF